MKIEKRGKYPGVKVHLDPEECEAFMAFAEDLKTIQQSSSLGDVPTSVVIPTFEQVSFFSISAKIGKQMNKLIKDEPDFLKERTPEQIKESLLADQAKIVKQLAAGGGWKQVD